MTGFEQIGFLLVGAGLLTAAVGVIFAIYSDRRLDANAAGSSSKVAENDPETDVQRQFLTTLVQNLAQETDTADLSKFRSSLPSGFDISEKELERAKAAFRKAVAQAKQKEAERQTVEERSDPKEQDLLGWLENPALYARTFPKHEEIVRDYEKACLQILLLPTRELRQLNEAGRAAFNRPDLDDFPEVQEMLSKTFHIHLTMVARLKREIATKTGEQRRPRFNPSKQENQAE